MKLPEPSSSGELRGALRDLRPYFVRCAWFGGIASLLVLVSSWYMLEVYDRVVNSRNTLTLVMLTVLVLAAFALMEVLEWAHSEEMRHAGGRFDAALRDRVFRAVFDANLRRIPGGTAQTLNDFRTVREFLVSPLLRAAMESPLALVFLAILFAIHPLLGVAGVVSALLQTFVAWMNERATQPPLTAANRSAITAQQYADASIRNAQVIEALGMLGDIHKRWFKTQGEFLKLQAIASDRAGVYTAMSRFLQTVVSSALLGLGAFLLLERELPGGGGMMIIGSIIGGRVLQPLVQIVTQWRNGVNARDAANRLEALLKAVPARPASMALPMPTGRLAAENLVVTAPGTGMAILRSVNFALQPGEIAAVIGPSASGKTTLARALTGVWASVGGKARLDGADIYTWDKKELGAHVGYLPQGVELFDGTIAENIARFGELDMDKVLAAARAVGLHEFITELPDGYDTELGPEGARLSGGQRQRVGLARALYGDPVFVVLDEPNSSLDEPGEAALVSAMVGAKARGTTFVVITHRMSLLGVADKILILRDGAQQLFGPRADVLDALARAQQDAIAARQQGATDVPAKPAPMEATAQ